MAGTYTLCQQEGPCIYMLTQGLVSLLLGFVVACVLTRWLLKIRRNSLFRGQTRNSVCTWSVVISTSDGDACPSPNVYECALIGMVVNRTTPGFSVPWNSLFSCSLACNCTFAHQLQPNRPLAIFCVSFEKCKASLHRTTPFRRWPSLLEYIYSQALPSWRL